MTELNPELIEHTPTTGQVMDAYVHINPEDASATPAAFDRWLSAVIREAKAEALRAAATKYQMGGWASVPQANADLAAKRSAAEHAVRWLRTRADRIEQGGQP